MTEPGRVEGKFAVLSGQALAVNGSASSCQWLIASRALINLSFVSFEFFSEYDLVQVNRCESADCSWPHEIARLSSIAPPGSTSFVSAAGFPQVALTVSRHTGIFWRAQRLKRLGMSTQLMARIMPRPRAAHFARRERTRTSPTTQTVSPVPRTRLHHDLALFTCTSASASRATFRSQSSPVRCRVTSALQGIPALATNRDSRVLAAHLRVLVPRSVLCALPASTKTQPARRILVRACAAESTWNPRLAATSARVWQALPGRLVALANASHPPREICDYLLKQAQWGTLTPRTSLPRKALSCASTTSATARRCCAAPTAWRVSHFSFTTR